MSPSQTLECCFFPQHCLYQLSLDDYVLRSVPLSSGHCPACEKQGVRRATVIFCPALGCRKVQLTRDFINSKYTCIHCRRSLLELCQRRQIQIEMERTLSPKLNYSAHLSPRESEIAEMLAKGLSNKEVAVALTISVNTARAYRATIMAKLNAHSLLEIGHYSIHRSILP